MEDKHNGSLCREREREKKSMFAYRSMNPLKMAPHTSTHYVYQREIPELSEAVPDLPLSAFDDVKALPVDAHCTRTVFSTRFMRTSLNSYFRLLIGQWMYVKQQV